MNDINTNESTPSQYNGLTYCGLVTRLGPGWRHKFTMTEDFTMWKADTDAMNQFVHNIIESSKGELKCALVLEDLDSFYAVNDFLIILHNNGVRDVWIYIDSNIRCNLGRSSLKYITCDSNYNPLDIDITFVFGEYQSANHAMVIDDKYITPVYRASFNQEIWKPAGPGYINITSKIDPNQKIWKNLQHN